MQDGTEISASIKTALKDALLSVLRCRAPQALTWHKKVWPCPPHQLSAIKCLRVRSNEWIMSGKTCSLHSFYSHDGGIPRQGRIEGCHRISAASHLICRLEGIS